MKNWQKHFPPYEGNEAYIYFAFAEADSADAWKIMRILLARGCRIWYSFGPTGGAEELLHRQQRAAGAGLTILYLSDAVCADKDTKSFVLVNQKFARSILCLDPDRTDRRLQMGLREHVPHIPLYQLTGTEEIESTILHAEGFSQEMLGEPIEIGESGGVRKLSLILSALAVLLLAVSFVGWRYLDWFRPKLRDEIVFSDPVILSAVREAVSGGAIVEETVTGITFLRLDGLPESWDELSLLPALERIELPQQAIAADSELPDSFQIELSGGGA